MVDMPTPLARVFARKTSYCPTDEHAYFDKPTPATPFYDEVHVSCTFTWDRDRAHELAKAWLTRAQVVKIGGPAFLSAADDFIPGRYMRPGIVFTSRGCPNACSYCFVPRIEGKFRELPEIVPGNVIQDNNLMAASDKHWGKVMAMLATQRQICLRGGIESRRLTQSRVADLAKIRKRIAEIWLACDRPADYTTTAVAIQRLAAFGFPRWKIRCYVIIGKNVVEEENRLQALYRAGCLPFAQLYKSDPPVEYDKAWKKFQNMWCRPPKMKAHMRVADHRPNKLRDPDR
jgi:hypothetical protein